MVVNNGKVMVSLQRIISQLSSGKVILEKLPPGIKSFRVVSTESTDKNEHLNKEDDDECADVDVEGISENNDEFFFQESDKKVVSSVSKPYCLKCKKTIEIHKPRQKNCTECNGLLLFKCMKCNKQYSFYKLLEYHMRNGCKSGRNFKCPKCNLSAANKNMLIKHFTNKHLAKKSLGRNSSNFITCSNCSKQFHYVMRYIAHLRLCKDDSMENKNTDVEESENAAEAKSGDDKIRKLENKRQSSDIKGSSKAKRNGKENSDDNKIKGIKQVKSPVRSPLKQIENNKPADLQKQYFLTKRNGATLLQATICYCMKCKLNKRLKRITLHNMTPSEICNGCQTSMVFKCKKCSKEYTSAPGMRYHLLTKCCPSVVYNCLKCDYKALYCSAIAKHIRGAHKEVFENESNDNYKCFKCNKEYKTHQKLKKHVMICGREPHLKCKKCSFKTSYQHSFDRHIKSHLSVNKKTINAVKGPTKYVISSIHCSNCNKSYGQVKSNTCPRCKNNFTFHCSVCNKSYCKRSCHHLKVYFKTFNRLVQDNGDVYYYECKNCTFKTQYQPNLSRHIMRFKH